VQGYFYLTNKKIEIYSEYQIHIRGTVLDETNVTISNNYRNLIERL